MEMREGNTGAMEQLSRLVNEKGNKQSIAGALHKKANKSDLKEVEKEFLAKSQDISKNIDRLIIDIN